MSITTFNNICYYFTFTYYLYEQQFDPEIIAFMENNNIQSKYTCFFDKIEDDVHYLIATNFDNTYKVITIKHNDDNHTTENFINADSEKILVYYNNIKISIFENIMEKNINNIFKLTIGDITNQVNKKNIFVKVHKMLEKDITKFYIPSTHKFHIYNLRILSVLTQVVNAYCNFPVDIEKFDVKLLFPNLRTLTYNIKGKENVHIF